MKLRILGNSVRLRLGPAEVARLLETGRVEQHVAFGPQGPSRLYYSVELSAEAADVRAAFDGSSLRVVLPARQGERWAKGREVGIEGAQDVGGGVTGETLQLLVEKDFACLDRNEPDADAYPNPNRGGA